MVTRLVTDGVERHLILSATQLVITGTPVYQIPTRLAAARDRALGRTTAEEAAPDAEETQPLKRSRPRRRCRTTTCWFPAACSAI